MNLIAWPPPFFLNASNSLYKSSMATVCKFHSVVWASSVLAICLCSFVGILIWHFRHVLCKRKLPPGSLGLPLLGETLQFALLSTAPIGTPLPFFSSRLKRYGPIFTTHLLGRPTVVSIDPDLTKFLLSNDGKLVQGSFPRIFTRILGPLLTLQGARHQSLRELANLTISSTAVQKLHVDAVQQHFLKALQSWQQYGRSEVFDAQHECKKWVFSYSIKLSLGLEADDPITSLLMRDFFILSSGYSSIPINLPGTKFNKVLKARQRILSTITRLAKSRENEGQRGTKDILNTLLTRRDGKGDHYSGFHIAEWIFIFVLGAFENTFVLITNVLKFLSENTHVVNELKRENMSIRMTKIDKERLTWDNYMQKMPFTRSVVRETLRLANIAPYIMKESIEEISFRDIIIPRGWMIILNFSMVHLNPYYYPNPLQFDPSRWMDSQSNSPSNNPDFLIPFGGGLRRCPGSPLATFEASIFIHYFVTLYTWKRVLGGGVQRDEVSCLSFPLMRNGLLLSVQPLDLDEHSALERSTM